MKKTFQVQLSGDKFVLKSESKEMKINKNDLEFKGQTFFTSFLVDLDITKKVEFVVEKINSEKWSKDELRVFEQIEDLILEIAVKINEEFNLVKNKEVVTE